MTCEGACTPCFNGLPPQPFVQVCMTCPPPGPLPTCPCPVKPLQLPCPKPQESVCDNGNFYNNYNMDYRDPDPVYRPINLPSRCEKEKGQTIDGRSPNCPTCPNVEPNMCCSDEGCPTGFKPCKMRLTPPPCCNPCGVWCAQVQPCPPKRLKKEKCVTCYQ